MESIIFVFGMATLFAILVCGIFTTMDEIAWRHEQKKRNKYVEEKNLTWDERCQKDVGF